MAPSKRRSAVLSAGAVLLAMVTYSYNVGWMFLPLYLVILFIWLMRAGKISLRELMLPAILIFIIEIPIMIFAVRSNIPQLNTDMKILWWTSPRLPVGRVKASFISFDGNILKNIFANLAAGFNMYVDGTDSLTWNSVGHMGPYYMFTGPFFIVGLITMLRRRRTCDIFVLSALFAMVPIMMVVTPNYNHWIFLHFPALITIVIGIGATLAAMADAQSRKIFLSAVIVTYVLFFGRFSYQYFNLDRNTGWETSAVSALQSLDTGSYEKVYFDSDNTNFLYFVRFCLPVSPYEYQKTRDNPYSQTMFGTSDHYANFERIKGNDLSAGSLFIVEQDKEGNYAELLKGLGPETGFVLSSKQYDVYKVN